MSGNLVADNDLSGFFSGWQQLDLSGLVSDTLVVDNTFGSSAGSAIRVGGTDNAFLWNTHTGTFPGWTHDEGTWSGSGIWQLCGEDACPPWNPTSSENLVVAPVLPEGTDPQAQWRDQGVDNLLLP